MIIGKKEVEHQYLPAQNSTNAATNSRFELSRGAAYGGGFHDVYNNGSQGQQREILGEITRAHQQDQNYYNNWADGGAGGTRSIAYTPISRNNENEYANSVASSARRAVFNYNMGGGSSTPSASTPIHREDPFLTTSRYKSAPTSSASVNYISKSYTPPPVHHTISHQAAHAHSHSQTAQPLPSAVAPSASTMSGSRSSRTSTARYLPAAAQYSPRLSKLLSPRIIVPQSTSPRIVVPNASNNRYL